MDDRETVMKRWDRWRRYIADGGGGDWPRQDFETLLDGHEEQLEIAEAEIERLRADNQLLEKTVSHREGAALNHATWQQEWKQRAESAEAVVEAARALESPLSYDQYGVSEGSMIISSARVENLDAALAVHDKAVK